jgi:hypothetical protein
MKTILKGNQRHQEMRNDLSGQYLLLPNDAEFFEFEANSKELHHPMVMI